MILSSEIASKSINNPVAVNNFITNPKNTFLISFPRTGSHWLRMCMELYFEKPSLTRAFYFPMCQNYLTMHTHDIDLSIKRSHVIYLYRNPIPTIYSQLKYHKQDIDDTLKITYWSDQYGRHLEKWLIKENFTFKKTIVTYEGLKRDMIGEFRKISCHFNQHLDEQQLEDSSKKVTKQQVKKKTLHDTQAMNLTESYKNGRDYFTQKYGQYIFRVILHKRPELAMALLPTIKN